MLAIQGIYNGKDFVALEDFPKEKKYKVTITFNEEIIDEAETKLAKQIASLDFWKNEKEDIYQDYLKK